MTKEEEKDPRTEYSSGCTEPEFPRWWARFGRALEADPRINGEMLALAGFSAGKAGEPKVGGFRRKVRVGRRLSDDSFPVISDGAEVLRLSRVDALRVAADILELAEVQEPEAPPEAVTALDLLGHVLRSHALVNRGDFIECSCGTTFWFSNRPAPIVTESRP